MKIAMIVVGHVGLVSGVCYADFRHDVICVDTCAAKLAKLRTGEMPIYELGLDGLMVKNMGKGRGTFSEDFRAVVDGADAVFIAEGMQMRRDDWHADLTYVMAAVQEIANALTGYAVVVTKSTVPVGTNCQFRQAITKQNSTADFDVASNRDFLIMNTDLESAGMIKYASNAFLATNTFINEVAMLCERTGADVKWVSKGIGLDEWIGNKFLQAGPGYGGSCFPKDTKALARMVQEHDTPMQLTETVIKVNYEIKGTKL